jgi:hypothetical protein
MEQHRRVGCFIEVEGMIKNMDFAGCLQNQSFVQPLAGKDGATGFW